MLPLHLSDAMNGQENQASGMTFNCDTKSFWKSALCVWRYAHASTAKEYKPSVAVLRGLNQPKKGVEGVSAKITLDRRLDYMCSSIRHKETGA